MWLGSGENRPAARVHLHSALLHTAGVDGAVDEVWCLLVDRVFGWPPDVVVSRLDVYADVQGWRFTTADVERFASRASYRRTHAVGRRLTGFTFGQGPLLARLYDKTEQMRGGPGLDGGRLAWPGRESAGLAAGIPGEASGAG